MSSSVGVVLKGSLLTLMCLCVGGGGSGYLCGQFRFLDHHYLHLLCRGYIQYLMVAASAAALRTLLGAAVEGGAFVNGHFSMTLVRSVVN